MGSRQAEIEYLHILEEEIKRNKRNQLKRVYESFYDWQRKFNASTKDFDACLLLAANQIGKTRTGTAIDAYHLLGEYPNDWEGVEFDFPPTCWLLGYSGEKTRDLLQAKLFGRFINGGFEGGYIPADRIIDHRSMTGTAGAMREVRVKHKYGTSVCQFWSYSQGQAALMGDVVDWYHIDEEPKDDKIFPQVLTRTLNGDRGKGGRGILTFTPENGKTQLVCKFMGEDAELEESGEEVDFGKTGMYVQNATWDQAPHISEDKKRKILAQYPAYQRKMRSEGQPLMGSGLIFEIDEDDIKCDPFEAPSHWFVINGIDFGWDHPQAHIQMVWDRDADIYYVINAWKDRKKQPFEAWHVVKPWAESVPTAWPLDGLQTEKGSARQQVSYYNDEGFNMLQDHATFEDGGNGVWAGIAELHNLMKTGRLKIVKSLHQLFEEIRQYHTKTTDEGRKIAIVKTKDDLLDACFHPDTEVLTKSGTKKIVDLVGTAGEIVSVNGGLQKYKNCRLTKNNADIVEIIFSDGHKVKCTPDHKFLTVNGWKSALHLHDQKVITADCLWKYATTVKDIQSLENTTGVVEHFCTETYGQNGTGTYQRAATYITSMATQGTIISKISNVLMGNCIFQSIKKGMEGFRRQQSMPHQNGARQKKGQGFVEKAVKKMRILCAKRKRLSVLNAAQDLSAPGKVNFAAVDAGLRIEENQELTTKQGFAQDAQLNSRPTSTKKQSIVVGAAKEKTGYPPVKEDRTLSVLQIRNAGRSDVYCMEVESTHAFALANGAIAHNCRYAYMMRRHAVRIADLHHQDYRAEERYDNSRDKRAGY